MMTLADFSGFLTSSTMLIGGAAIGAVALLAFWWFKIRNRK